MRWRCVTVLWTRSSCAAGSNNYERNCLRCWSGRASRWFPKSGGVAQASRWGGKRARALSEPKPKKEGRATAARPSSRSLLPKAAAPKLHQRNGDKRGWHLQRKRKDALRPLLDRRDSQPISSEPAPSHRPWASAPGATPQRTISEHGDAVPDPELQPRPPLRTRRGPGLHKPANEEPPQGGSWYPSAACRSPLRSQPRSGDPGCPHSRRDPSQIGFSLRQTGIPSRVRSLPYVTQRSPFRLPSYVT